MPVAARDKLQEFAAANGRGAKGETNQTVRLW
jgi:hypothetical protein